MKTLEHRPRRQPVAVPVERHKQVPLPPHVVDPQSKQVAGLEEVAVDVAQHLVRHVGGGRDVEGCAGDENDGVLAPLAVERRRQYDFESVRECSVISGLVDKGRRCLLQEHNLLILVRRRQNIAHPSVLVVDERLTQVLPYLLPPPRRHAVRNENKDGVEDGEVEDLELHADRLLFGRDRGVFAPRNRANQRPHHLVLRFTVSK
mmetsp:Transcript_16302/g.44224  ORF Transcript_16302/g.44224 Transcript_16302/m.44224 type:complete len:204 (-) Transcript_16302:573-1184(-)